MRYGRYRRTVYHIKAACTEEMYFSCQIGQHNTEEWVNEEYTKNNNERKWLDEFCGEVL